MLIVPIPLWRRVPPGAQNELKEEEEMLIAFDEVY